MLLAFLLPMAVSAGASGPELVVSSGEIRIAGSAAATSKSDGTAMNAGRSALFFPSAADPLGRQGFVRVVNHSNAQGTVSITAFDDSGRRHGPVTLAMDALETVHFNSGDLEDGNASKGLSPGVGRPTQGDWRLELASELNVQILSYIRTSDGFVTSMHDVVPSDGNTHRVAFFNPGSNFRQESLLRVVNPGDAAASVTIRGVDDGGSPGPGGSVGLSIPAQAARTYSAAQLEGGATGLSGSLGDGAGKWRLAVEADVPIQVMSLLATPTGHLTNLSTDPSGGAAVAVDDKPPAPTIKVTGARTFEMIWGWSLEVGETYAFDFRVRLNRRDWSGSCGALSVTSTANEVIITGLRLTRDIVAGDVIEAEYRYRNSSSCDAGSPGPWSHTGSHLEPPDDRSGGGGGGSQSPDLVVEAVSVSNGSPAAGASFRLSATVRNGGDGSADATTLRYYRSTNSTISSGDTEVGTDSVGALSGSATSAESISLTAPSSAGTYYYGACVDSVSGESSTANNCSDGVSINVSGGGGADSYCRPNDIIQPGGECEIYNTSITFDVDANGRGCVRTRVITNCSSNRISINATLNGERITIVAQRNGDNSWTIDDVDPKP